MSFPNGFGSGFGFGFLSESGVSDDMPEAQQAIRSQTGGVAYAGQPKTTSPSDIAGMVLWLRGDAGITIATGVSVWTDQSATGDSANKNVVQATGSAQPTFNASDAAYNGRPTLSFASASSQYLSGGAWSVGLSQPYTLVVVGNPDATANNQVMLDNQIASGSENLIWAQGGLYFMGGNNTAVASSATPVAIVGVQNGATSPVYVSAKTPVNVGATSEVLTGTTIGATISPGSFLNGKIAEVIVYNRALSNDEALAILAYCGSKFAIAIGA